MSALAELKAMRARGELTVLEFLEMSRDLRTEDGNFVSTDVAAPAAGVGSVYGDASDTGMLEGDESDDDVESLAAASISTAGSLRSDCQASEARSTSEGSSRTTASNSTSGSESAAAGAGARTKPVEP